MGFSGASAVEAWQGDITTLDVDAIVNAANAALAAGSGVCGAIFAAAGPELGPACAAISGCATGDAVATPGFALAARHVIHTVGPVWHGGTGGEPEQLASCYRRSLEVGRELGATSIAFPAISTGVYGYPAEAAAEIAVATTTAHADGWDRIVLCAFDLATYDRYRDLLERR